jgi:orotate phosphoribosyltransferase
MEESKDIKTEFIEFLLDVGVLKFGEFTLKSGRKSPYFFNMGSIDSGPTLANLGIFFAQAIHNNFGLVDNIFGPAYKGITLASAAAIGFALEYEEEVNFCFDRKEIKDHGDRGKFVGAKPVKGENVVIVDDVMTTGGTKYEAVELLRAIEGVEVAGLVIGMNRKEKDDNGDDAIAKFTEKTGVNVYAIADIDDVIEYLKANDFEPELIEKMEEYIEKYSV